jgi:hypothetical protein
MLFNQTILITKKGNSTFRIRILKTKLLFVSKIATLEAHL